MPTLKFNYDKGLSINDDGELIVKVDKDKESELKVSENGVWAKGIKRLDDQCTDDWSVIVRPTEEGHENDPKNIMGNGRVATKIRIFSFMKHARRETDSGSATDWYLKSKDPNSPSTTSADLKTATDVLRELNFSTFYSDGSDHGPVCAPRPGTLIGFSDAIYGTTKYSSRIYEDGKRFPSFIRYKLSGSSVVAETIAQHVYALFMVTRIIYTDYSAKAQNISATRKGFNPTNYRFCHQIELQCLWSDQEAFKRGTDTGLLNADGWRKGEFLTDGNGHNYGKWSSSFNNFGPDDV